MTMMNCKTCRHYKPTEFYISMLERANKDRLKHKQAVRRRAIERYGDAHCAMVIDDPDFPVKLGELSNWDEELMPKHCDRYSKKDKILLFTSQPMTEFVGAYTSLELCKKAEVSIPRAKMVQSFKDFKGLISQDSLRAMQRSWIIKLDEINHEIMWDVFQKGDYDTDRFKPMYAWDWVRSLFPSVGNVVPLQVMTKGGLYKQSTITSVIRDLRSPKYAKGPVIDVRPKFKRGASNDWIRVK